MNSINRTLDHTSTARQGTLSATTPDTKSKPFRKFEIHIAIGITLIMIAGCSSDSGLTTTMTSLTPTSTLNSPPASQPTLFDPPQSFPSEPTEKVEDIVRPSIAGGTVYGFGNTADNGMSSAQIEAIDLNSGNTRWQVAPPSGISFSGAEQIANSPKTILGTMSPQAGVYYVGTILQPGQGTQQNQFAALVGMLSADTGTSLWTSTLPLPLSYYQDQVMDPSQYVNIGLVGADEHHLVVTATGPYGTSPITWVLNPSTGQTKWTQSGISAIALGSGTVVAFPESTSPADDANPEGLSADTGAVLWPPFPTRINTISYAMVGPTVLQLGEFAVDTPATYLVDVRTGKVLTSLTDGPYNTCMFDEVSTIACPSDNSLIGLDASTGQRLWSLPDPASHRIKPALHAAYHGLLYTQSDSGAVILDARTGSDKIDNANIAPDIILPGYGIEVDDINRTVAVYRAAS